MLSPGYAFAEDMRRRRFSSDKLSLRVNSPLLSPFCPQHPMVVSKVQSYLDDIYKAGSQGSWSTWRMKLPPTILTQMAQIIARAERSSRPASAAGGGHARESGSAAPSAAAVERGLSRLEEDLLSSEELIEKFGLQSLMDGDGDAAADRGKGKQAQLLAATLHPDDGAKLKLGEASQGAMGFSVWIQVILCSEDSAFRFR